MAILHDLNDIFKRFYTLLLSILTLFKHIQFSKPRRSSTPTATDAVILFDSPRKNLPAVDLELGEISPVPKVEVSTYDTRSGGQNERVLPRAPIPEADGHLTSAIPEPSIGSTPNFPPGRALYGIYTHSRDGHASSTSSQQTMPIYALMDLSGATLMSNNVDHLGKIALWAPQYPISVEMAYRDTPASNSAALPFYHGHVPKPFSRCSSGSSMSSKHCNRNSIHYEAAPSLHTATRRPVSICSLDSTYSNFTDSSHSFASNSSASPSVYATSFPRPPNLIAPNIRSPHRYVVMNPVGNGTVTAPSKPLHVAKHRKRSPIVWSKDLSVLLADSAPMLSSSPGPTIRDVTDGPTPRALPAWLCVKPGSQFSSHIGHFRYPYQHRSRPPGSLASMDMTMHDSNYRFPPSPRSLSQSGSLPREQGAKGDNIRGTNIDKDPASEVRSVMQETPTNTELESIQPLASTETSNSLKMMAVSDEVIGVVDSPSTELLPGFPKAVPPFTTDDSFSPIYTSYSTLNPKSPSGLHSSESCATTLAAAAKPFNDRVRSESAPGIITCSSTANVANMFTDISRKTRMSISGKTSPGGKFGPSALTAANGWAVPTLWGRFSYPSTLNSRSVGDVRMSGVVSWSDFVTFSSHKIREGGFNVGAGEPDRKVSGGNEADQALGMEVGNVEKDTTPLVRGHVRTVAMRIEERFKALDRDVHWSDVVNLDKV